MKLNSENAIIFWSYAVKMLAVEVQILVLISDWKSVSFYSISSAECT